MIRRIFISIFFGAVASLPMFAQTKVADLRIDAEGQLNVPVYRVAIDSNSADLLATAKRAFSLHGSYILTTPAKAQFTFSFAQAGANAVQVVVKGGTSFSQVCNGSNLTNALMKACDVAVERTLRTPGFFAGKIVFSYSRAGSEKSEICLSDMVFKNVRALTNDKSDSLMPHFSPNGSKVMYTGYYRTGFMDLFQIDLNTNSRKVFASYKGSNTGGTFSPNGSMVALVLSATGNAEIWTASATGRNFKRLTTTKQATESSPCFSPDGSKILFASDSMGAPQLFTMPVSGGKATRIRTNISRYCAEPTWNYKFPNKIAFTLAMGRGFQVGVYDFNTGKTEVISQGASTSNPKWLNDGRHIICTKTSGGKRQLYVIDSETKRQAPLHTVSFGSAKEPDFVY